MFNQNLTAWRSAPGAVEMERQVVRWLDEMIGFDGPGHGLLVSGGSAANTNALGCAISKTLSSAGIDPADRRRLRVYISQETHISLRNAAKGLGLGTEQLRILGVDNQRRLIPHEVDAALTADLAAGALPACVCASAGTANTGAIDPLEEIADLCSRHRVWFHIDGAYGAPAAATDDYRWLRRSFARADSISLDPHKWLFAPIDVGCVLVRDPEASRQAFAQSTEYIAVTQTAPREGHAFFDHGSELTRRLRALKVWAILKSRGVDQLAAIIAHNIELRRHLDRRVAEHPRLEGLGSELSIACFRHIPEGWSEGDSLNTHNRCLLETLVREGRFFMSPTTLDGNYSLRVCIVNFRTTHQDIDLLIDEVLRIGSSITQ
jgi:glutamate/tyrosine decarboxylase-like PLP-dependent enzyme